MSEDFARKPKPPAVPDKPIASGKIAGWELYQTPDGAELVGSIPMTAGSDADPYLFWSVYCLTVPSLKPGDLVRLDAQLEGTNPTIVPSQPEEGYIEEWDAHLAIVDAPLQGVTKEGARLLSLPAGDNITPYRHHDTINRHAYVSGLSGDVMFSLVVTGATEVGQLPADLTIENNYGCLSAFVLRSA